jgi:hypothetical protein
MTSPNLDTDLQATPAQRSLEPRVLIGDGDLIVPSQAVATDIPMPDPDVQRPDQLWDRRLDRW